MPTTATAAARTTEPSRPVARIALAALAALAFGHGALRLAQVDGGLGPARGADRLLARIDADPQASAANAADARRMLAARPIDGRAFRVLAHAPGSDAGALLAIAVRRAPRDRIARAESADRAFAAGDIDGAMAQVDALLRVAPRLGVPMLQHLLPLSADARVRAALLARLADDPPWRGALPRALAAGEADPALALALLDALAASKPLPERERAVQVALLRRSGWAGQARAAWLAALPAAARDPQSRWLYDGGFEHEFDAGGGYGWRVARVPGADPGFDAGAPLQGRRSLAVDFAGRAISGFRLAQWLALPPGDYRLQAALDDATDSERPFRWRLACSGGPTLLELDSTPGRRGWQRLAAGFAVPAGCPGQELWLEQAGRSLEERRFEGRLRLDAVAIARQ
jgi:hypothetical protein